MYYQRFLTSTNVLSENPGWYKCTIKLIENHFHSLPAVVLSPFTGCLFVLLLAFSESLVFHAITNVTIGQTYVSCWLYLQRSTEARLPQADKPFIVTIEQEQR